MANELHRVLRNLYAAAQSEAYQPSCWTPAADVYRASDGWLVKLDLAGVRPEEIQVSVEGRRLIVRGMRRDLAARECQQAYSMEISYNRFERSIEFPTDVAQAEITTDYRDGMLTVALRTETARP